MVRSERRSRRRGRCLGGAAAWLLVAWLAATAARATEGERVQPDPSAPAPVDPPALAPVEPLQPEAPLQGETFQLAPARPPERARLAELLASARDFALALAAQAQGDLDGAAEAYTRALNADPQLVEAAVNLARVQMDRGRTREARKLLDRAVAIDESYPAIYVARGLLALREGELRTARNELERAIPMDPDAVEPRINLAALLIRQGLHAKARPHLERALQTDPEQPEAHLNLGIVADATGEPGSAAYFYAQYLALADVDPALRRRVERRLAALTRAETPAH